MPVPMLMRLSRAAPWPRVSTACGPGSSCGVAWVADADMNGERTLSGWGCQGLRGGAGPLRLTGVAFWPFRLRGWAVKRRRAGWGVKQILRVSELWSCCPGGVPLRSQDPLTLTLSRRERGWGGPLACATAGGRGGLAVACLESCGIAPFPRADCGAAVQGAAGAGLRRLGCRGAARFAVRVQSGWNKGPLAFEHIRIKRLRLTRQMLAHATARAGLALCAPKLLRCGTADRLPGRTRPGRKPQAPACGRTRWARSSI